MPQLHPVSEDLGKAETLMAEQAQQVGFFQTCIEARGPHKISSLPQETHTVAPLLNYTRKNGVPISIPMGMNKEEIKKALSYGANSLYLKENLF